MTFMRDHIIWGGLLLACVLAMPVQAQPNGTRDVTPYFHEAAQQYVASNLQQALATVNEGLRIAPDDRQLQALRDAIQQERQRSGGGSGGQQESPEGGQNAPNANTQGNNESRGQDGAPEQDNRSAGQPNSSSQGQGAQDGNASNNSEPRASEGGSGSRSGQNGDETRESGLSQAQAARILRALETQEKQLLRQVLKRDRRPQRILKEW